MGKTRPPADPDKAAGGGGRKGPDGRIVVEPIFRIASVPTREGRRTVHVECAEDFKDAEFRMFVDENVDATCDRQTRAQAAAVLLSNVTVGWTPTGGKGIGEERRRGPSVQSWDRLRQTQGSWWRPTMRYRQGQCGSCPARIPHSGSR